jgi:hypothetical protein
MSKKLSEMPNEAESKIILLKDRTVEEIVDLWMVEKAKCLSNCGIGNM